MTKRMNGPGGMLYLAGEPMHRSAQRAVEASAKFHPQYYAEVRVRSVQSFWPIVINIRAAEFTKG